MSLYCFSIECLSKGMSSLFKLMSLETGILLHFINNRNESILLESDLLVLYGISHLLHVYTLWIILSCSSFCGRPAGLCYGTKTDVVSLWQTILPSYRREHWQKQFLHFENGLWAWYHTCDQLKQHSCSFSHPSEAALHYGPLQSLDVSLSRWITGLLICSHHPSCCLIYRHPSLVLMFFHCSILMTKTSFKRDCFCRKWDPKGRM